MKTRVTVCVRLKRREKVKNQLSNGVAYKAKVGLTCLSQRIRVQVMKDVYLLPAGQVNAVL